MSDTILERQIAPLPTVDELQQQLVVDSPQDLASRIGEHEKWWGGLDDSLRYEAVLAPDRYAAGRPVSDEVLEIVCRRREWEALRNRQDGLHRAVGSVATRY